jgi:hypothetical protein
MNNIWITETRFSIHLDLAPRWDSEVPIAVINHVYTNSVESFNSGTYGGFIGPRPSPAADLILKREDFDVDYFAWGGCNFVPERMRQAMALDSSEIRFFEVDASQSASLPRSKNYQMMEPTVMEDVLDVVKSGHSQIAPGHFEPLHIDSMSDRQDAAPTHDLFYERSCSWILLCTDLLAMRILKAGCTGMTFTDPNRHHGGAASRYRTLRGIEEFVDWDQESVEITRLIQAIE